MKHTPEENWYALDYIVAYGVSDGISWESNDLFDKTDVPNAKENAERAVACVKFCKGISNEELEDMARHFNRGGRSYYDLIQDMRSAQIEAQELSQQNAELIEALEMAERLIATKVGDFWNNWPEYEVIKLTLAKSNERNPEHGC